MKRIKFLTALISGKLIALLLKICGRSATSFPGMVAMKLDKDFIDYSTKHCRKKIITVTGTNGKTTTTGFIANILKHNDNSLLHNQKGANMPQGIATALACGINPFLDVDYFVLENDEAYLETIYEHLTADYLLVTNLFRDQLDRYGELQTTAKKINNAIQKNRGVGVILNADDPMLNYLTPQNVIRFGFDKIEFEHIVQTTNTPKENVYCQCGRPLIYKKNFYAHLGHYCCICGYQRKTPEISANAKIFSDNTNLEVTYNNRIYNFTINLPGLYNAYNALGAIALSLVLGIETHVIQEGLNHYKSVFGRAEKLLVNGKNAFIQLIKNPVGASEVLKLISHDKNSKMLIIINDDYADGRDVSWLWDANFEALKHHPGRITVSGKRAYDMALRLKYTGFDYTQIQIIPDIKKAILYATKTMKPQQTLHILPTYTALLKMQTMRNRKNNIIIRG